LADPRGIVIAAPSSSSGKTVATLGLLRAFAGQDCRTVSAKVGPDYIDPRYHEAASGQACVNLDGWAMRPELLSYLAARQAARGDLCLIEGVMGLFDGPEQGFGSTADIAVTLGLPIVLVVDVRAQARSAAAVVHGFSTFRSDCTVAGVIANRIGSPRHADMIGAAMDEIGVPMLGALPIDAGLDLPSRHLGLVQAEEHPALECFIETAARLAAEHVDLERLRVLAAPLPAADEAPATLPPLGQTIAVARDEAFGFAYTHLLEAWRRHGAEIKPFSPLADEAPAEVDAVFLPGGYPELHAGRLAANVTFLAGVRQAADNGALVYGECGGYMVLGQSLIDAEGTRHAMAGLLPVETSFAQRQLHLGYRTLDHDSALPWPKRLRGHEFHYSSVVSEAGDPLFAAHDTTGRISGTAGLQHGLVMGSYGHVIDMM